MTNYLIDTHTLLWHLEDNSSLSKQAKQCIEDPQNLIFVNIVSFWEIVIKLSLGKLKLSKALEVIIAETKRIGIDISKIEENYILQIQNLPFHHRDPFDRMLRAQCLSENIPIISIDEKFDLYSVSRIW